MLNRRKRSCRETTVNILFSLKEGSDSGSMIFCMAAFVSVLLLQKELEEDLVHASPVLRFSLLGLLSLCVIGFALHAYRKENRHNAEKILAAEESERLNDRIKLLEEKVAVLEVNDLPGHKTLVTTYQNIPLSDQQSGSNTLTIPLLRNL